MKRLIHRHPHGELVLTIPGVLSARAADHREIVELCNSQRARNAPKDKVTFGKRR